MNAGSKDRPTKVEVTPEQRSAENRAAREAQHDPVLRAALRRAEDEVREAVIKAKTHEEWQQARLLHDALERIVLMIERMVHEAILEAARASR